MEKSKEYILKIYKEQSFSKAAAKLFITQPALSAIVKKEEQEYGVAFFNRNVKPIKPTEAGLKYIHAALKIQKIETSLGKELRLLSNTLFIGSSAFFCANVLPLLTDNFSKQLDFACNIHCIEGNATELVTLLQSGYVDFVISVDSNYGKNYDQSVLAREAVILAVPKIFVTDKNLIKSSISASTIKNGQYLHSDFPSVSLKSFDNNPFILLAKGNDMYYRAKKILKKANVKPKEITYMDQLMSSFFAAKSGKGIVFIRAAMLKYIENTSKLLFFKIDDSLAWRNVNIIFKSKESLTPVANNFLSFCQKAFTQSNVKN